MVLRNPRRREEKGRLANQRGNTGGYLGSFPSPLRRLLPIHALTKKNGTWRRRRRETSLPSSEQYNADGPVFRSLIISRSFTVDGLYFWMILSLLYWLCKISSPLILDLENSLVSDFQNEEGSND